MDSEGTVLADVFTVTNDQIGFDRLYHVLCSVTQDLSKGRVGLEATGHYSYNLLGFLLDKGLTTYVLNPLHVNLFRKSTSLRRTKTDRVDARTIAAMMLSGIALKPYSVTSYHNEQLKSLTRYEKKDVVRLFGLTEGIPAVAKELDPNKSDEENLRTLLAFDSAFSTYLPQLLRETFRAPESYYPIIASIARGKHRLSEIAKDVGFPNNKCGTYLDALIEHGFVREEKNEPGTWARYYLANSYYIAWGRYVYGKQNLQAATPDLLLRVVKESIDEAVALPALHAACTRYIQEAPKYELSPVYWLRSPDSDAIKKAVPVKLRDGSTVILDYYGSEDGDSLFGIFPHELDKRYTKDDYERITKAISQHEGLKSAYIFLFSLYRFSDWIVHKAAHNDLLYAVTVERLKY